jgi:DNA/RNA-binding domain of Phe-tRNA-synthetase-like protein
MRFEHAQEIWDDFPALVAGVVVADDLTLDDGLAAELTGVAASRLAQAPESELPEIQAWRRAFAAMGLKPTQYRCAAEALLRRYRKEGSLPRIHPLIDLCNAASLAFAIPVAVFDRDRIVGDLRVRYADGDERYLPFGAGEERPQEGEVIFADAGGRAHARRWTNRQSAYSAVGETTGRVLIVAEALHSGARDDVERLVAVLDDALSSRASSRILTRETPSIDC